MASDHPRDGPPIDELCHVLASERRRAVLYFLRETADGTADVETLTEHVVDSVPCELDGPAATGPADRVLVDLAHVHLPKLDAVDLVEYAPDAATVEYEGGEVAEALLEATPAEG